MQTNLKTIYSCASFIILYKRGKTLAEGPSNQWSLRYMLSMYNVLTLSNYDNSSNKNINNNKSVAAILNCCIRLSSN